MGLRKSKTHFDTKSGFQIVGTEELSKLNLLLSLHLQSFWYVLSSEAYYCINQSLKAFGFTHKAQDICSSRE